MKKLTSTLLSLTFLLVACTSSPTPTQPPVAVDESEPTESESTTSESNNQPQANREAIVAEFENNVTAQTDSSSEFLTASVGLIIPVGGTIQTGDDSRAKLTLSPEGTIIRVGPNSSFTLFQVTEENGEPKTKLQLLFGKVFVILNGGSLEVETPSGVASVRGSLLSVQYDPNMHRVRASCLEGTCGLENIYGEESSLTEGQSCYVNEDGELSEVSEIDQDEIEAWLAENPDLDQYMDELPDPNDYPDFDDEDWYQDSSTSDEDFSSEEDSGSDTVDESSSDD